MFLLLSVIFNRKQNCRFHIHKNTRFCLGINKQDSITKRERIGDINSHIFTKFKL